MSRTGRLAFYRTLAGVPLGYSLFIFVALRRIESGEEITYDYGRDYLKHFLENGGTVAQHAAERELFVTGELAAANRPNKFVVSVCVPRRSSPFPFCLFDSLPCASTAVVG